MSQDWSYIINVEVCTCIMWMVLNNVRMEVAEMKVIEKWFFRSCLICICGGITPSFYQGFNNEINRHLIGFESITDCTYLHVFKFWNNFGSFGK